MDAGWCGVQCCFLQTDFWLLARCRDACGLSRCPDQILRDDLVVPAGNGVPNVDQGTSKKNVLGSQPEGQKAQKFGCSTRRKKEGKKGKEGLKDRRPLLVDPRSYRVRMMARTTTMTGGKIKEKKKGKGTLATIQRTQGTRVQSRGNQGRESKVKSRVVPLRSTFFFKNFFSGKVRLKRRTHIFNKINNLIKAMLQIWLASEIYIC